MTGGEAVSNTVRCHVAGSVIILGFFAPEQVTRVYSVYDYWS